jgi:DNA-binding response OmpR family regulator
VQELAARLQQQPPSARAKRPDVSPELDGIIRRLMALRPDDRFPNPRALMRVLLPFLKPEMREHALASTSFGDPLLLLGAGQPATAAGPRAYAALLVDDEPDIRTFCRFILQSAGLACDEAACGSAALEMARQKRYDLIVLDIHMPDLLGTEVCRRLRENPPSPNLKIIMVSGVANSDTMAEMLLAGADDFVTKPFSVVQLQARVKAALRLKDAQDRSDLLNSHLLRANQELEQSLGSRDADLVQARNALVLALAKLVEQRSSETGAHLIRMQLYCRTLAEEAARHPAFQT